ncbi:hypothetical protein BH09BAC3_BH09BAC3_33070 [soil metagenome]
MPDCYPVGRSPVLSFTLIFTVSKKSILMTIEMKDHTCLSQYFFLHYNIALKIKFSLMPEGTVGQVMLASSWINCKLFCNSFVVSSSFVAAGLRGFSFRIWHNSFILTFSIFPIVDRWHLLLFHFLKLAFCIPAVCHFLRGRHP